MREQILERIARATPAFVDVNEDVLARMSGVGASAIFALALVAELFTGKKNRDVVLNGLDAFIKPKDGSVGWGAGSDSSRIRRG